MNLPQRTTLFIGLIAVATGLALGLIPFTMEVGAVSFGGSPRTIARDCRSPWIELLLPDGSVPEEPPHPGFAPGEAERDLTPEEARWNDAMASRDTRIACGADASSRLAIPLVLMLVGSITIAAGILVFQSDPPESPRPEQSAPIDQRA